MLVLGLYFNIVVDPSIDNTLHYSQKHMNNALGAKANMTSLLYNVYHWKSFKYRWNISCFSTVLSVNTSLRMQGMRTLCHNSQHSLMKLTAVSEMSEGNSNFSSLYINEPSFNCFSTERVFFNVHFVFDCTPIPQLMLNINVYL